jgi:hypothetical protein
LEEIAKACQEPVAKLVLFCLRPWHLLVNLEHEIEEEKKKKKPNLKKIYDLEMMCKGQAIILRVCYTKILEGLHAGSVREKMQIVEERLDNDYAELFTEVGI